MTEMFFGEGMNKLKHIHTIEYYSALESYEKTWKNHKYLSLKGVDLKSTYYIT